MLEHPLDQFGVGGIEPADARIAPKPPFLPYSEAARVNRSRRHAGLQGCVVANVLEQLAIPERLARGARPALGARVEAADFVEEPGGLLARQPLGYPRREPLTIEAETHQGHI